MKKPLIIANWKMNPDSPGRAAVLAQKTERAMERAGHVDVVVAPPFPFLLPVAAVIKRVKLGSQDVFWEEGGAYTGEVSWHQLTHMNITHVIVGHSERRRVMGETDAMINRKVSALLENAMMPVLCVGERERNDGEKFLAVDMQIETALAGIRKTLFKNLIICYEPVWAISTNFHARPDTPVHAFRAMTHIREFIAHLSSPAISDHMRVIYGGSVHKGNIKEFLEEGGMQGALVGGASLDAAEFKDIMAIAGQTYVK